MPLNKRTLRAKLPDIISWISILAAVLSIVEYFERYSRNQFLQVTRPVVDLFNILHGPSIFLAVLLFVFASAAYRRKRVVVWFIGGVQLIMIAATITQLATNYDLVENIGRWYLVLNLIISVAILAIMIWAREEFASHIKFVGALKGSVALVIGQTIVLVVGYGLVTMWPGHLAEGGVRLQWVLAAAFGYNLFTEESILPPGGHLWLAWVISVLSLIALLISIRIFLRSQKPGLRSAEDDLDLHRCLANYPGDSLSYFATGNVRQVCFSRDRKAAVSYAVVGDVALAGGDPVGDPAAWEDAIGEWLKLVYRDGHVPGVIGCSRLGARAYRTAGFRIRAMGDEAIVMVDDFNSNLPTTKPLLEARRRVQRAGVAIECRKLMALSDEERAEVAEAAERFRQGEERGFSMALDRLLEPLDANQLVVTARDAEGQLEAVLTFVPWGRQGLSLNLMRRKRTSTNGVIEAMVLHLIDYGREHRVEKISLNFAMFRQVFEDGAAVDATLTQQGLRKLMQLASKFWQLQSLYESNARYLPEWQTRYFGYSGTWQLTSTAIASGRAEGFLPAFGWEPEGTPAWVKDEEHIRAVHDIYDAATTIDYRPAKLNEQQRVRRDKAAKLHAAGMDPYPPGQPDEHVIAVSEIPDYEGQDIWVHARIQAKRNHGGLTFVDLYDGLSASQALFQSHAADSYALVKLLDVGDTIAVHGRVGASNTGERTIFVDHWRMLAKSLRPVPPPSVQIDRQTLSRDRTLQFINQPRSMTLIQYRSRAGAALRTFLGERGYSEVETPILNPVSGGANARPFFTHLNAYNATVSLRIAPELYLKRLAIGGMKAVFELGKSFRNEGVDATHNPEFISLEAYKAGSDYTDMRKMTESLIRASIQAIHGKQVIWQPKSVIEELSSRRLPNAPKLKLSAGPAVADPSASEAERAYSNVFHNSPVELVEVDVTEPWPVVTVLEGISVATGQHVDSDTSVEDLCALAQKHGVDVGVEPTWGHAVNELYEALVEPTTSYPTFYTDFPAEISPLTRGHRADEKLAEKWDLVAFGMELGTAYTELTDPREQAERFFQQSLAAAAGDPEAMSLDQDFLDAMELGLVPTGGMGMGFDRMVMMICGTDIRQIITFPYVRPLER